MTTSESVDTSKINIEDSNMKRDWELIRRLLFKVENMPPGDYLLPQEIADENPLKVGYHFKIMIEAGLIFGTKSCDEYKNLETCFAVGILWQGHELLDSIRKDSMWKKIKITAIERSSLLSFEAIKAAISHLIKEMI